MATRRSRKVYNSEAWLRLRERARKRAGCTAGTSVGRCEHCGCTAALSCHHVIPLAAGGPAVPKLDGVVMVCKHCHAAAHNARTDAELVRSQQAWDRLVERPN